MREGVKRPMSRKRRELEAAAHRCRTLAGSLGELDAAVFLYPVELKCAGDLRFWIAQAVRELAEQGADVAGALTAMGDRS